MLKEGKFGVSEAVCLVSITITTKVFYTSPSLLADLLGTSSWYMTLISAATACLGFVFIYLLLKRFDGNDIVQIYKTAFGRFLGSVFSLMLCLFLLLISFSTIREFTDVFEVYVMPRASADYLTLIFIAVCASFCFYGLESIARFSRASAYFLLLGLVVVLVLSFQNYHLSYLFPFFGRGLDKTIEYGLMRSSSYGEVVLLSVFAPALQGAKYVKRAGYSSLIISGLLISVTLMAFTLTFPYTTAAELTSPMYEFTMQIGYGRFFQRLDPIFLFVWIISSFITVSALLYGSLSTYAKIFSIDNLRPCLIPFFAIVFCLTLMPRDIVTVSTGLIQNIRSYGWTIYFVLPLLALVLAAIRKKKEAAKNA
jgi:spore germination protein (amino acid permease)